MQAIGIDVGGTNIRAARLDRDGTVLASAQRPSDPDPREALARVLALVDAVRGPDVVAIGIGVPGQVEPGTGRVLSGGYVDFTGVDVVGALRAATGLPVAIENDAVMALLGEAGFGAARGAGSVAMLTIGTGIGGAILERGEVLRGRGLAGQLGHLMVDPAGRPCVCGRRGCLETVSSGTAFASHLAAANLAPGLKVEQVLARGDAAGRAVIAAWITPLRQAIESLIAALDPERVVLGGGAGAGALAALQTVPVAASWFAAPVVLAELGDRAGMAGAAAAALKAKARGEAT